VQQDVLLRARGVLAEDRLVGLAEVDLPARHRDRRDRDQLVLRQVEAGGLDVDHHEAAGRSVVLAALALGQRPPRRDALRGGLVEDHPAAAEEAGKKRHGRSLTPRAGGLQRRWRRPCYALRGRRRLGVGPVGARCIS
jgi:hypothetical protein